MLLKKIELFGFKSFVDRCVFEISPGISAFVGPNGCGKSNIIDAIRWALGERSLRALRGKQMEDMIFNGAGKRRALNIAEVSLTFEQIDSQSEFEIKRRVHRSGENEYWINGRRVQYREMRALFSDTGIGASSYSVMEQGKIDRILSSPPEARRELFEEAAAIRSSKAQTSEAETQLRQTEENLRQAERIFEEIGHSYRSLRRQSEAANRYRESKQRLFATEVDIRLLQLQELAHRRDERQTQLNEPVGRRARLQESVESLQRELEEDLDAGNSLESELIALQQELATIDREEEVLGNRRRGNERLVAEIGAELGHEQTRMAGHAAQGERLEGEIDDRRSRIDELRGRAVEIESNIVQFRTMIEGAEERRGENDIQIGRLEGEIVQKEEQLERLRSNIGALTDDIGAQLDRRLRETGYSGVERVRLEGELQEALHRLQIQIEGRWHMMEEAQDEVAYTPAKAIWLYRSIREALIEGNRIVAQTIELFERYRLLVPAFLDDFLVPDGIITRKRALEDEMDRVRNAIPTLRQGISRRRDENRVLVLQIGEARATLEETRIGQAQIGSQIEAREGDVVRAQRDLAELGRQQGALLSRIEHHGRRIEGLKAEIETARRNSVDLSHRREELRNLLRAREKALGTISAATKEKRRRHQAAMNELSGLHSIIEDARVALGQLETRIAGIYTDFREHFAYDLREAERQSDESLPELRRKRKRLRDEIEGLGSVNLMAIDEFVPVSERYHFMADQINDLKQARADLRQLLEEIGTIAAQRFGEAFDRVRRNFHEIFRRLFGGGRAGLRLTDPNNLLASGVEIAVQLPGKKIGAIESLSGGERSLAAVALLFAIYMVRPSPFCLLDEIDAALDEANVGRFIALLSEFSKQTQFLIITHNRRTIAGVGTLFGVTMEEQGISKIVGLRMPQSARQQATA